MTEPSTSTGPPLRSRPTRQRRLDRVKEALDGEGVDPLDRACGGVVQLGERNIEALIDRTALSVTHPSGVLSSVGKRKMLAKTVKYAHPSASRWPAALRPTVQWWGGARGILGGMAGGSGREIATPTASEIETPESQERVSSLETAPRAEEAPHADLETSAAMQARLDALDDPGTSADASVAARGEIQQAPAPHPDLVTSDAMEAELSGDLQGDPEIAGPASPDGLRSDAPTDGPGISAPPERLEAEIEPVPGATPEQPTEPDCSDMPKPGVPGDKGPTQCEDLHYESVADHDVVPAHPTPDSTQQGSIGDCNVIAAMAAVSDADPDRWSKIVHDNGDDTVTVDLVRDGKSVPTTVAKTELVDDDGAQFGARSNDGTSMAALVEKAYAKEFAHGSYAKLNEGGLAAEPLEAFTGKPGHESTPDQLAPDGLRALLADGHPVCAGSIPQWSLDHSGDDDLPQDLDAPQAVGGHMYVVKDVGDGDQVQLHNPWGFEHVTLPWDQFERQFDYVGWS